MNEASECVGYSAAQSFSNHTPDYLYTYSESEENNPYEGAGIVLLTTRDSLILQPDSCRVQKLLSSLGEESYNIFPTPNLRSSIEPADIRGLA